MSGILATNFRKGNLSELVGDYLLSSIGIATPVRRQDDIGFDFYCQLSDQVNAPILTFSHPFIMQIKSDSVDGIVYGNSDPKKWRRENIQWLFQLEWPLFIGVINKKENSIQIYRTTKIWFPLYENPECTQIELIIPGKETEEEIKRPDKVKIDGWPNDKGDGFKYLVPLGNPIISFSYDELDRVEVMEAKKSILRNYIHLEMSNITFRRQGIKHFQWVPKNKPNEAFNEIRFMYYGIFTHDISPEVRQSLTPGLVSLLFQLSHHHDGKEEVKALKEFMKHLPNQDLFRQLKGQHSNAFDWVD